MTLSEFATALDRTTRVITWHILPGGAVRGYTTDRCVPVGWGNEYCPITAVCGAPPGHVGLWDSIAATAGLPHTLALAIVLAADNDSQQDAVLRARMLRVLGLEEGA